VDPVASSSMEQSMEEDVSERSDVEVFLGE
jgi:hypothetical protein